MAKQSTNTVTTLGLRAVLVGLASIQCNTEKLLKESEINRDVIDNPEGRLPCSVVTNFWEIASREVKDPILGINMGSLIPYGTYQTSDFLLSGQNTILEGVKKYIQFFEIIHQGINIEILEKADRYKIVFTKRDNNSSDHEIEYELALLFFKLKHISQNKIKPIRILLSRSPKVGLDEYQKIFNCEISFNQPQNSISFDKGSFLQKSNLGGGELSNLMEQSLKEKFQSLQKYNEEEDFLLKIKNIIRLQIVDGDPSLSNIANELGSSERTIQRRLKEHNLSFMETYNEVRKDIACNLLQNKQLTIAEAAFITGFSETSSFHRAFKKWTGITPQNYRKQL